MAAKWTYLIADLLTDEPICYLPLSQVSFDHRISQAGVFQARLPIVNRTISEFVDRVMPRDPADISAGPGRIVCHCLRQAPGQPLDLWGSFWVYNGKVSQSRRGNPVADLRGMSLDGYLNYVEVQNEDGLHWTATDTAQIARELITDAMAQPYADIGFTLQTGSRGEVRDYDINPEEAAKYGERVQDIANAADGFEWHLDTYISSGTRHRYWTWGNPLTSGLEPIDQWEQPGNVLEWSEERDATRAATRWRTRGDSVNDDVTAANTPLVSDVAEATTLLAAGWPRTDKTVTYPGVDEFSALQNYAAWWAANAPGVASITTATVRLPAVPRFTPHDIGSCGRLRLVNTRYPLVSGVASYLRTRRVIGMGVKPAERGSQDEAQLIFEELTPS